MRCESAYHRSTSMRAVLFNLVLSVGCLFVCCAVAICCSVAIAADNQTVLGDICRLKGQEENTLQGLGLVVGLKGTGDDASKPTSRGLARAMQFMGGQIAVDGNGLPQLTEVEKASNVALVMVTADLPAHGAQQGDQLDCTISAIYAKSLEGGTLIQTPLLGPRVDQPTVYALAKGKITIPDPRIPTSASIHRGCKMEATVKNEFVKEGKLTLILDRDVSDWNTAQDIEDVINELNNTGLGGGGNGNGNVGNGAGRASSELLAKAQDAVHIEVTIPSYYRERPVAFVSFLMQTPLPNMHNKKRVVINEREGVIIIGEDVVIDPVAITHKNLSINATAGGNGFVGFDPSGPQPKPKLKNLVDALNALNVPSTDVIAIIKSLKIKGGLTGELVVR